MILSIEICPNTLMVLPHVSRQNYTNDGKFFTRPPTSTHFPTSDLPQPGFLRWFFSSNSSIFRLFIGYDNLSLKLHFWIPFHQSLLSKIRLRRVFFKKVQLIVFQIAWTRPDRNVTIMKIFKKKILSCRTLIRTWNLDSKIWIKIQIIKTRFESWRFKPLI